MATTTTTTLAPIPAALFTLGQIVFTTGPVRVRTGEIIGINYTKDPNDKNSDDPVVLYTVAYNRGTRTYFTESLEASNVYNTKGAAVLAYASR